MLVKKLVCLGLAFLGLVSTSLYAAQTATAQPTVHVNTARAADTNRETIEVLKYATCNDCVACQNPEDPLCVPLIWGAL
jgi:hypothetical protein